MFEFDPPALHPRDELDPAKQDLSGPAVPVMGQSVVPDEVPDALLGHRRPPCNFPDADVIFVFRYMRACSRAHPELRSNMSCCSANLHADALANQNLDGPGGVPGLHHARGEWISDLLIADRLPDNLFEHHLIAVLALLSEKNRHAP